MHVKLMKNALDRTPISLIIDDSAPLVNLNYFFLRDRNAWRGESMRWEDIPVVIPESFTREWAEWCGENGVKGKFSVIPIPAGLGRIDQDFPLFNRKQLESWLHMCRETITPNFDITPEMLTHSHLLDLKTLQPVNDDAWEQYSWKMLPEDQEDHVTRYISLACEILCNVGLEPQGVTSPGDFGSQNLQFYAKVVGNAVRGITGNPTPFFFQRNQQTPPIPVPVWYADKETHTAVGEIIATTPDYTGFWTGYGQVSVDNYITDDLQGGCLPTMLNASSPCVLCSHWQGFYGLHNGDRRGFHTLQAVVDRLLQRDPYGEYTRWRKVSEITNYACALEMTNMTVTENEIHLDTPLLTPELTLSLTGVEPSNVKLNGQPLTLCTTKQSFGSGTFYNDGKQTLIAFDPKQRVNKLTID